MTRSTAARPDGYGTPDKMRLIPETWLECIGLSLREWRLERSFTTEGAAKRARVSQASWSRWETGHASVPFEALIAAGVPLDALAKRAIALAEEHGISRPLLR